MKLQTQQINKLKKHAYLISFILIIIISFIALNAASGLIFSTYKLDLTQDKRYTLHPQTTQILQNIPHPITINVYYSSSISKDYPLYSQYAQLIMRTLDKYQNVSKNKIKVNMLDPVPYTSTEEDAIRYGLRKFSNQEGESGYYFGAVLTNTQGQKYTIPYFQIQRQNYLENDLTRAIVSLGTFNHRNIGIMSPDIPMIDTSYRGRKANKDWTFIKLLRQDYNIVEISANISEIPLEIETLILVTTNKLPTNTAYVIDQFVMRGGKLIVMVDPHSVYEDKIKGITSPNGSDINILLAKWGISYEEDIIVGDKRLSHNINLLNGSVKKFFPIFNLEQAQISNQSPITQGLSDIFFNTPGGLEFISVPEVTTIPLLTTSAESIVVDAKISKFGSKEDLINSVVDVNEPITIAALSSGNYQSAFQTSPLPTDIMNEILPHITSSILPTKIIVIADADWIYQQSWIAPSFIRGNTIDEIVSLNNNFDFLLRAVDYLTSNEKNMHVGPKVIAQRDNTLAKIIEKMTAAEYSANYQNLQKDFEENKMKLNSLLLMIKNQEIAASIKNYAEINNLQRNLQKKQEHMRRMEYKIKESSQNMTNIIITLNLLIFPIITIAVIVLIAFLLRHRNKVQAERIINE